MEVANASLLDEATGAAEAMALLLRVRKSPAAGVAPVLLVADTCFPQTIAVVQGRAEPLGITVRVGPIDGFSFDAGVFGAIVQSPDAHGALLDLAPVIERAHAAGAGVAVGADLLSLALVKPPGELGADIVYGSAQRFGVPLGLRRAARRLLRHPPGVRAPHAGTSDRCLGGLARPDGVPHGARHSRAAHPAREGHLEHLHRPGAAGVDGGDVRRVPRARGAARDCRQRARSRTRAREAPVGRGLPPGERGLLRHDPARGPGRMQDAEAARRGGRHQLPVRRGSRGGHRARRNRDARRYRRDRARIRSGWRHAGVRSGRDRRRAASRCAFRRRSSARRRFSRTASSTPTAPKPR